MPPRQLVPRADHCLGDVGVGEGHFHICTLLLPSRKRRVSSGHLSGTQDRVRPQLEKVKKKSNKETANFEGWGLPAVAVVSNSAAVY